MPSFRDSNIRASVYRASLSSEIYNSTVRISSLPRVLNRKAQSKRYQTEASWLRPNELLEVLSIEDVKQSLASWQINLASVIGKDHTWVILNLNPDMFKYYLANKNRFVIGVEAEIAFRTYEYIRGDGSKALGIYIVYWKFK